MIHRSSSQSNKQQKIYTEHETIELSAQCYILLEKYKLRTNLVGMNLQKDQIQQAFSLLEERIVDRYSKIYQKLKEGLNKLETQFALAQGNALRTLNNIIRNYRRRVGTLSNEPLNNLKYNRFQKQQKVLLETLIYSQRENYPQIQAFKLELQKNIEGGLKQIEDRYHKNSKIREDPSLLFDVIDKSQCYTYKYYQNFQRSMITTLNTLQGNFEKLDAFLSVWENIGSTKAYEVKSIKQIQSQQKSHEVQRNRRYYQQETEQQLEEMMKNCPQNSPQRQQYRKRLNQLRRYNSEKQKKLDMVGKMYSKRRNRAGILVNKNKDISVLQWVINSQNNKVPYSYVDEFKNYKADNQHSQYRLTVYQSQKPMKNGQQIKQHIERYSNPNMSFEWWYDRFGKDGNFDLITSQSQMVQKRLQFEVIRQIQLQNNDDRRKRQQLQKHNYQIKQNERKENLHIGYLHVHDKTQLQSLIGRKYNTQYIPGPIKGHLQDDIYFSDDEVQQEQVQEHEQQSFINDKVKIIEKSAIPLIYIGQQPKKQPQQIEKKISKVIQIVKQPQQIRNDQEQIINDSLEQKIVKVYFKQYSKKMLRKQSEPQYRKTHFFYFRAIDEINWPLIAKNVDCQKIFIYTEKMIIFSSKVVSIRQEKIKCNIYSIDEDNQQQEQLIQKQLNQELKQCFHQYSLVTIKFHPVYLENDNAAQFMIGLLSVLLREDKMPDDYERKDYLSEGKQIIEDFNQYFFPEENNKKNQYLRKFKPLQSKDTDNYSEKSTVINETSSNHSGSTSITLKTPKQESIRIKNQTIKEVSQSRPPQPSKPEQDDQLIKRAEKETLKRSNSREFLNRYEPQISINSYASEYVAEHKSIQQDYQQL